MKVLFDHQIFNIRLGGAPKYFSMLLANMPRESWQITALRPYSLYLKDYNITKTYPYRIKGQALITDFINKIYTNRIIQKRDFDVFHQTNFGTYCFKSLGNKPMVTTYHDSNLSTIDPHPEIVKRQALSLMRANAIICVSENTKKDMLNLFNIDENKVHVIYHGIDIPDLSCLSSKRIIEYPYILYVGRRSYYKNFNRFVKAFANIHEKYKNLKICCTTSDFTKKEHKLFQELGIEKSMIYIPADEDTLQRLYRDALFFIFPSIYEGFGMPILEAWSCECPVVLSNTSCFPEIAADAGLYFNPTDIDDITYKMSKLIEDNELRQTLIHRGKERVKVFSWKKCANEHMKVYQSIM